MFLKIKAKNCAVVAPGYIKKIYLRKHGSEKNDDSVISTIYRKNFSTYNNHKHAFTPKKMDSQEI